MKSQLIFDAIFRLVMTILLSPVILIGWPLEFIIRTIVKLVADVEIFNENACTDFIVSAIGCYPTAFLILLRFIGWITWSWWILLLPIVIVYSLYTYIEYKYKKKNTD